MSLCRAKFASESAFSLGKKMQPLPCLLSATFQSGLFFSLFDEVFFTALDHDWVENITQSLVSLSKTRTCFTHSFGSSGIWLHILSSKSCFIVVSVLFEQTVASCSAFSWLTLCIFRSFSQISINYKTLSINILRSNVLFFNVIFFSFPFKLWITSLYVRDILSISILKYLNPFQEIFSKTWWRVVFRQMYSMFLKYTL